MTNTQSINTDFFIRKAHKERSRLFWSMIGAKDEPRRTTRHTNKTSFE